MVWVFVSSGMSSIHFPYQMPIEMRWKDVDQLGHVNHTVLLTYCEEARLRFLFSELKWDFKDLGLIIARIETNFLKPVLYPNDLIVKIAFTRIGNTSFDMANEICSASDESEIFLNAKIVLVVLNPETGEPTMVPNNIRNDIELSISKPDQELS